jgi:branched-chain amino acid transport system permease protein
MLAIYVMLGGAMNVLLGYGGMVSLCQAAFYGVGAYTTSLLATRAHCPLLLAIPLGVLVCAVLAAAIGPLTLHFRGDRFVLLTIALQALVGSILNNLTSVTGGNRGIYGIPPPSLFGITFSGDWAKALFVAAIGLLCLGALRQLHGSPYTRTMIGIRDDQTAAESIGKNPLYFRTTAFVISSLLCALAGSSYALSATFIDPTSFTLEESVFILTAVVIGGCGNVAGPVAGACVVVFVPECLRLLHVGGGAAANARQILYGILLIALMRCRPNGITGEYDFS